MRLRTIGGNSCLFVGLQFNDKVDIFFSNYVRENTTVYLTRMIVTRMSGEKDGVGQAWVE